MDVSAWFGGRGNGIYGIRVGVPNRARYFQPSWNPIQVEMDGQFHSFNITPGFWKKSPEFRDSGQTKIRDWLRRYRTLDWVKGSPPRMSLIPLGEGKFRLVP
jgi:hypothetical protein